jgi:hypothetical protein
MDTIKAPQTDIQAYLYNNLNIEIYEDLTEAGEYMGLFEPLEFFNLLYSEFEYFQIHQNRYLEIKRHFSKINLEGEQRYYFFWALHRLLDNDISNDDEYNDVAFRSYEYVLGLYREISKKLYPSEEKEAAQPKVKEYDFEQVKEYLETLPETNDKIKYLIEVKTDYLQNRGLELDWGTSFDKQCELEILKIEKLSQLEGKAASKANDGAIFKLIDKKGVKVDFIRILYAIYELKIFEKPNGQIPTKDEFMKEIGGFFGEDLSTYHAHLSQAFGAKIEDNLKVFKEMEKKVQEEHFARMEKKKNIT